MPVIGGKFRHDKDKDTVDRRELRIALNEKVTSRNSGLGKDSITFTGFHNAAALTDAVVDDIILNRPAPGEFKSKLGPSEMQPMTITQEELEAAFARMHYSAEAHAPRIFQDIRNHREPVWLGGDVVKDLDGVVWVRAHNSQWVRPGSDAFYGDNMPLRPLKRMVPESSSYDPCGEG
jgi:hypothetical protein